MTKSKLIGKRVPRHDAYEKAMGLTCYAADFYMSGMLIGKVLRSQHPSAKIHSIITSKAKRLQGVKAEGDQREAR